MSDLWCLVYLMSRPQVDESSDIVSWLPSEMTSSHKSPPLLLVLSSSSLVDGGQCGFPLSSTLSEPTRKLTCSDSQDTDSVDILAIQMVSLYFAYLIWKTSGVIARWSSRFGHIWDISRNNGRARSPENKNRKLREIESHMLFACVLTCPWILNVTTSSNFLYLGRWRFLSTFHFLDKIAPQHFMRNIIFGAQVPIKLPHSPRTITRFKVFWELHYMLALHGFPKVNERTLSISFPVSIDNQTSIGK